MFAAVGLVPMYAPGSQRPVGQMSAAGEPARQDMNALPIPIGEVPEMREMAMLRPETEAVPQDSIVHRRVVRNRTA